MNCWKSINVTKQYGLHRLYFISFLTGLLSFIILYVPVSILHGTHAVKEIGMVGFIAAILLLPMMHAVMHILPLILVKKRINPKKYSMRSLLLPSLAYTQHFMSKRMSIAIASAPTLFITIPGLIASCLFVEYDVYILLFTSAHIGFSYIDFLFIAHIYKAPKKSFVENGIHNFDILTEME